LAGQQNKKNQPYFRKTSFLRKILLDEDSGAPDKFIPDEEVTPEIAKKLYYRCIRKNKTHNKVS